MNIAVKPSLRNKTYVYLIRIVTFVHDTDAASGLTRDLAFSTKHLGINLADDGPGFNALIGIRLWTLLLIFLLFRRDQYGG